MFGKHDLTAASFLSLHSAQPLNMGIHVSKSLLDVSVPCKRENHLSMLRSLLGNTSADFVEASPHCLSNANR